MPGGAVRVVHIFLNSILTKKNIHSHPKKYLLSKNSRPEKIRFFKIENHEYSKKTLSAVIYLWQSWRCQNRPKNVSKCREKIAKKMTKKLKLINRMALLQKKVLPST